MSASKFKDAMARLATGVSVLTCKDKENLYGMTISSLTSVGLNPPTVSVCVEGRSSMVDVLRKVRCFGVTVLKEDQVHIGRIFSDAQVRHTERFAGVSREIINDCVVIEGGLAALTCEIINEIVVSENAVFFGRINYIQTSQGNPAIYYHRSWQKLNDK